MGLVAGAAAGVAGGGGSGAGGAGSGAAAGVVVGIVTDNDDPERLGRVKLRFPSLSADYESHWARVAAPGNGASRGTVWIPEVNDEVLVAFEGGDRQRPFVSAASGTEATRRRRSRWTTGSSTGATSSAAMATRSTCGTSPATRPGHEDGGRRSGPPPEPDGQGAERHVRGEDRADRHERHRDQRDRHGQDQRRPRRRDHVERPGEARRLGWRRGRHERRSRRSAAARSSWARRGGRAWSTTSSSAPAGPSRCAPTRPAGSPSSPASARSRRRSGSSSARRRASADAPGVRLRHPRPTSSRPPTRHRRPRSPTRCATRCAAGSPGSTSRLDVTFDARRPATALHRHPLRDPADQRPRNLVFPSTSSPGGD